MYPPGSDYPPDSKPMCHTIDSHGLSVICAHI